MWLTVVHVLATLSSLTKYLALVAQRKSSRLLIGGSGFRNSPGVRAAPCADLLGSGEEGPALVARLEGVPLGRGCERSHEG